MTATYNGEGLDKWDRRFLDIARQVAAWSKDRSTQVGSVIVRADRSIAATGFNGFPRGVDDDKDYRHQRPDKYLWTEHAERNAIFQAAKHGVDLNGATIYLQWFPCAECARAIVQVGITRLVGTLPDYCNPQWGDSFIVSRQILGEGGVHIDYLNV